MIPQRFLLTFTLLTGLLGGLSAQSIVERGGMQVRYEVESDGLTLDLSAPTTGWVAIGFNTRNDIVGTDLKMFRVREGVAEASDHIVRGRGVNPTDEEEKGTVDIKVLSGRETADHTQLRVRLPLQSGDPCDMPLAAGQEVWLIMAYSVDDDFTHHSRMRQHVRIRL